MMVGGGLKSMNIPNLLAGGINKLKGNIMVGGKVEVVSGSTLSNNSGNNNNVADDAIIADDACDPSSKMMRTTTVGSKDTATAAGTETVDPVVGEKEAGGGTERGIQPQVRSQTQQRTQQVVVSGKTARPKHGNSTNSAGGGGAEGGDTKIKKKRPLKTAGSGGTAAAPASIAGGASHDSNGDGDGATDTSQPNVAATSSSSCGVETAGTDTTTTTSTMPTGEMRALRILAQARGSNSSAVSDTFADDAAEAAAAAASSSGEAVEKKKVLRRRKKSVINTGNAKNSDMNTADVTNGSGNSNETTKTSATDITDAEAAAAASSSSGEGEKKKVLRRRKKSVIDTKNAKNDGMNGTETNVSGNSDETTTMKTVVEDVENAETRNSNHDTNLKPSNSSTTDMVKRGLNTSTHSDVLADDAADATAVSASGDSEKKKSMRRRKKSVIDTGNGQNGNTNAAGTSCSDNNIVAPKPMTSTVDVLETISNNANNSNHDQNPEPNNTSAAAMVKRGSNSSTQSDTLADDAAEAATAATAFGEGEKKKVLRRRKKSVIDSANAQNGDTNMASTNGSGNNNEAPKPMTATGHVLETISNNTNPSNHDQIPKPNNTSTAAMVKRGSNSSTQSDSLTDDAAEAAVAASGEGEKKKVLRRRKKSVIDSANAQNGDTSANSNEARTSGASTNTKPPRSKPSGKKKILTTGASGTVLGTNAQADKDNCLNTSLHSQTSETSSTSTMDAAYVSGRGETDAKATITQTNARTAATRSEIAPKTVAIAAPDGTNTEAVTETKKKKPMVKKTGPREELSKSYHSGQSRKTGGGGALSGVLADPRLAYSGERSQAGPSGIAAAGKRRGMPPRAQSDRRLNSKGTSGTKDAGITTDPHRGKVKRTSSGPHLKNPSSSLHFGAAARNATFTPALGCDDRSTSTADDVSLPYEIRGQVNLDALRTSYDGGDMFTATTPSRYDHLITLGSSLHGTKDTGKDNSLANNKKNGAVSKKTHGMGGVSDARLMSLREGDSVTTDDISFNSSADLARLLEIPTIATSPQKPQKTIETKASNAGSLGGLAQHLESGGAAEAPAGENGKNFEPVNAFSELDEDDRSHVSSSSVRHRGRSRRTRRESEASEMKAPATAENEEKGLTDKQSHRGRSRSTRHRRSSRSVSRGRGKGGSTVTDEARESKSKSAGCPVTKKSAGQKKCLEGAEEFEFEDNQWSTPFEKNPWADRGTSKRSHSLPRPGSSSSQTVGGETSGNGFTVGSLSDAKKMLTRSASMQIGQSADGTNMGADPEATPLARNGGRLARSASMRNFSSTTQPENEPETSQIIASPLRAVTLERAQSARELFTKARQASQGALAALSAPMRGGQKPQQLM